MNDLQTTLLLVGGGGIVGMIAYNWWQDYRLRKQASERFGGTGEDPLLGQSQSSESGRDEPTLSGLGASDPTLQQLAPQPDAKVFADIVIRFESPMDSNAWQALVDSVETLNRKQVWCAVSQDDGTEDHPLWYVAKGFTGTARSMRVSVQLANRNGPLTSIEFSELLSKLRHFCDNHQAHIEFPEMKEVMVKAETLDKAAAALDTLLGLHCLLPEQVGMAEVEDRLRKAGWSQRGHHWQLFQGQSLLVGMVVHQAPGKRLLSFTIDVPNSIDPVRALGDVVTFCHGLNAEHGAPMMDDSGRTLNTEAIEGIYQQLIERMRNLSDSGFAPGSASACILFS